MAGRAALSGSKAPWQQPLPPGLCIAWLHNPLMHPASCHPTLLHSHTAALPCIPNLYCCRLGQETHELAQRKQEQMERLRGAFGLGTEEVAREGDAFNRELQEQKRLDKIAEREKKEKEHKWVGGGG